MKLLRKFLPLLLVVACLSGCEKEETTIDNHQHTFDTVLVYNETHHWYPSTCGHSDAVSNYERHSFKNNVCECGATQDPTPTIKFNSTAKLTDLINVLLPESMKTNPLVNIGINLVKSLEVKAMGDGENTYSRYSFTYPSTRLDGSEVMLSGAITIPYAENKVVANSVIISSHPTLNDLSEAPSLGFGAFSLPTITGSILLEFDLLGYGISDYDVVDYHCRHLSSRNTVDGILTAKDLIKSSFNINIDQLTMYNVGYSQGGYDSLALIRYMEQEATEAEKDIIHISSTFSGSGAYDPMLMLKESLNNENFPSPEYILMAVDSAFNFHDEDMGNLTYESILTKKGMELLEIVRQKSATKLSQFKDNSIVTNKTIFTSGCFDSEGELMTAMSQFAEKENLIDGKWNPTGNIVLSFSEGDELVTPKCTKTAKTLWKNLSNVKVDVIGTLFGSSHTSAAIEYYLKTVTSIIDEVTAI